MGRAFGLAWSMLKAENGPPPIEPKPGAERDPSEQGPYENPEIKGTPFGINQQPNPFVGRHAPGGGPSTEQSIFDIHPDLIRDILNRPYDDPTHESPGLGDLTPTEGGPREMSGERWNPVEFSRGPQHSKPTPPDYELGLEPDSMGGGDFSDQLKNRARQAKKDEDAEKPPKDEKEPPKDEDE